jgi:CubicO group peptidase (beta-lactamase class C family)
VILSQSLEVFLRTKIFEPLGMKDTGFWVDASKVDRVTSVFTYSPDKRLVRATRPARTRRPLVGPKGPVLRWRLIQRRHFRRLQPTPAR